MAKRKQYGNNVAGGKLTLHVPETVRRDLRVMASINDLSLSNYVAGILEKHMSKERTKTMKRITETLEG